MLEEPTRKKTTNFASLQTEGKGGILGVGGRLLKLMQEERELKFQE